MGLQQGKPIKFKQRKAERDASHPDPGDLGFPTEEAIEEYKGLFTPMSEVRVTPPAWVIPNLLVPGLNLIAAPPKHFKSTLVFDFMTAVWERQPVAQMKNMMPIRKGPMVYFAAEQKASRIKDTIQTRLIKRPLRFRGVSWDWVFPKNAWKWQIDEPESETYNMERFIRIWKPMILVIDPLIRFHSIDENDPRMVRPLVPLWEAMTEHEGALVVVHHSRKKQGDQGSANEAAFDFDKVRGTSALWGMADAGILLSRMPNGSLSVQADYKEHPRRTWIWRPDETVEGNLSSPKSSQGRPRGHALASHQQRAGGHRPVQNHRGSNPRHPRR